MWHADGVKPDAAEVDRLADAAAIVLPALTEWLRFADVTAPARSRTDWQSMLDQPLPKDGAGFEAALSELAKWVVPNGLPVGAPGFTGFITTGPTTSAAVAQLAATVASPQRYAVSAFNLLEAVSLRWLAETCALPSDLTGVYSSGGSTANLLALGAARQAAFERRGVDVARDGLPARTVGAVYASASWGWVGKASGGSPRTIANGLTLASSPRWSPGMSLPAWYLWPSSRRPGPPTPVRSIR